MSYSPLEDFIGGKIKAVGDAIAKIQQCVDDIKKLGDDNLGNYLYETKWALISEFSDFVRDYFIEYCETANLRVRNDELEHDNEWETRSNLNSHCESEVAK